jgi:hypothetical protein
MKFPEKNYLWARSKPDLGRSGAGPPTSIARGRGTQTAAMPGPLVSASRRRNGMERPGPSDQVLIDGPWLSPSSSSAGPGKTLAAARQGAGAHLGCLSDAGGGDEATECDRASSERGGTVGLALGKVTCACSAKELGSVLSGFDGLTSLGQGRGRVR